MIWSWYSLRKGAINPRHAWHADPTADGPPPLDVAVARSRRRDTTRVGRLIFAARAALSSRVCLHLAKTAQRRRAPAARYPTPLRLIPRHYNESSRPNYGSMFLTVRQIHMRSSDERPDGIKLDYEEYDKVRTNFRVLYDLLH